MSRLHRFVLLVLLSLPAAAQAGPNDCPPGFHGGSPCVPDGKEEADRRAWERQAWERDHPPQAYDGPMPSFRDNAIFNAVSVSARQLSPNGAAAAKQWGGVVAYDVYTVPEVAEQLELVARIGLAGGAAGNQNKYFDLVLGLGGGATFGDFTVMALAWMTTTWEGLGKAPAMKIPFGMDLGPELHLQYWISQVSLDVSAARVYRFLGGEEDPLNVDQETRLSAAVGFGDNLGVTLGGGYVGYGIGHAVLGTVAFRWGARGR